MTRSSARNAGSICFFRSAAAGSWRDRGCSGSKDVVLRQRRGWWAISRRVFPAGRLGRRRGNCAAVLPSALPGGAWGPQSPPPPPTPHARMADAAELTSVRPTSPAAWCLCRRPTQPRLAPTGARYFRPRLAPPASVPIRRAAGIDSCVGHASLFWDLSATCGIGLNC